MSIDMSSLIARWWWDGEVWSKGKGEGRPQLGIVTTTTRAHVIYVERWLRRGILSKDRFGWRNSIANARLVSFTFTFFGVAAAINGIIGLVQGLGVRFAMTFLRMLGFDYFDKRMGKDRIGGSE
jgi:hypothetical protein